MKRKLTILLVILLLIAALTACAPQTVAVETTSDDALADEAVSEGGLAEDAMLEISGEGIDIALTAADMQALEIESFSCDHVDSNGEVTEVNVAGFALDTVLSANGASLADTASLNLIGSDGYIMAAPAEEYAETGVYILLSYDGEALTYPRSCIPDKRAMYWVKDLAKIEVVAGGGEEAAATIVGQIDIFQEGVTMFEGETLNNQGYDVTSYSLQLYFEHYIGELPKDPLTMIARDGFEKTETAEVFFENYVTLEGESEEEEADLPLYFSETISDGMRVKQLDYVLSGANAIYFGNEITVPELFAATGMGQAESYTFIANDGYETIIPADAIEYGKIYTDAEEGYIRADFEGYDWGDTKGGGKVKYLVTIKADGEVTAHASADAETSTGIEASVDTEATPSDALLVKCFVGDEKTMMTEADFLALPQIEVTLSKTNSKGETTTSVYEGVHWTDIAAFIDADAASDVVLVASDGYEMTITSDMLNDPDSLFALYQDGENIASEDDGRVWFCVSENFTANNWVKYITKIVVD